MRFLENMISPEKPTIVMGDVNWHYPDFHPMKEYMDSSGFYQLIGRATHEGGQIIDHLYISSHLKETKMVVEQLSSYYTDHDVLKIFVPLQ